MNAYLLSTRIIPHPGVGRAVEGTNVPSGDVRVKLGTTLKYAYTRLFEDNLSALDTDVTQTVRGGGR